MVNLKSPGVIFLFCLIIAPLPAFCGDFDGSKSLTGNVDKILEIALFDLDASVTFHGLRLELGIVIDSGTIHQIFRTGG